jgi:hypothetical protein
MSVLGKTPETDGEVRSLILETIMGIRNGTYTPETANAMFSGFKELNASMNTSIAAAKLALQMENSGKNYVKTIRIGKQAMGDDE